MIQRIIASNKILPRRMNSTPAGKIKKHLSIQHGCKSTDITFTKLVEKDEYWKVTFKVKSGNPETTNVFKDQLTN